MLWTYCMSFSSAAQFCSHVTRIAACGYPVQVTRFVSAGTCATPTVGVWALILLSPEPAACSMARSFWKL